MNNKTMWAESFTAAARVLQLKSGLKDSSFKRARAELKEKGYIDYQSRDRNQAPVYRMIKLTLDLERGVDWGADRGADRDTDQDADHLANRFVDQQTDHHTAPLIKQKKDKKKPNQRKQNDNDAASDAFLFYQENIGVISPFVSDDLLHWVNDIGEDLVLDAMKRALEQGKGNWGYVKGILQAWMKKGITSVEAAKAEEAEFRRSRSERGRQNAYVAEAVEVIPDWFKEQKRKEKLKRAQQKAEMESLDPAAEQAEIEELLKEFRKGREVS